MTGRCVGVSSSEKERCEVLESEEDCENEGETWFVKAACVWVDEIESK